MRSAKLTALLSLLSLLGLIVWAACSSPPRFAGSDAAQACAGTGAFTGADPQRGLAAYERDCAACHSLKDDKTRPQGPNLQGIVSRRIGSAPGFRYSKAFRNRQDVWTLEALDRYLQDPEWSYPGTRMRYMGMVDPDERRDVIALLACEAR